MISKQALDATIKDYANCGDTNFEGAMFDIFESELGEQIAAEHELTLDQIEAAAEFYYWKPNRQAAIDFYHLRPNTESEQTDGMHD